MLLELQRGDDCCCSIAKSCLTLCDPMDRQQHTKLPCPSPSPRACSNSCLLSRWYYPAISSSVIPFSSCLQSFPSSGSFSMNWLFASCGQRIGISASASILPMNIQGWFSLELTGLISLQSRGLSRVFSNTTLQKHQFFSAKLSLYFCIIIIIYVYFLFLVNSHIHIWLLEKT